MPEHPRYVRPRLILHGRIHLGHPDTQCYPGVETLRAALCPPCIAMSAGVVHVHHHYGALDGGHGGEVVRPINRVGGTTAPPRVHHQNARPGGCTKPGVVHGSVGSACGCACINE